MLWFIKNFLFASWSRDMHGMQQECSTTCLYNYIGELNCAEGAENNWGQRVALFVSLPLYSRCGTRPMQIFNQFYGSQTHILLWNLVFLFSLAIELTQVANWPCMHLLFLQCSNLAGNSLQAIIILHSFVITVGASILLTAVSKIVPHSHPLFTQSLHAHYVET